MMDEQALIQDLDGDLAGALGAIILRITSTAKVTGRHRPRLTQFLVAGIPDEQAHAQLLAREIVALGGEPTTVPRASPKASTNREIVEAVLSVERNAVEDYIGRAKQARDLGHNLLAKHLQDIAQHKIVHTAKTERILSDWPL